MEVRLSKIVNQDDDKSGLDRTKVDGFPLPFIIFRSRSKLQVFALSKYHIRIKFSSKVTKKLLTSAIVASY